MTTRTHPHRDDTSMHDDHSRAPGPPPILIAAIAVGWMIGLAIWAPRALEARAQQNFKPTVANVVAVRVVGGAHDRISHNCSSTDGRGPRQVYVEYTYEVDGAHHSGDRYDEYRGELFCEEAAARDRAAAVTRAGKVEAFYDPRDPSRAVLTKTSQLEAQGVTAFFILAASVTWIWFVLQLRRRRQWRRQ